MTCFPLKVQFMKAIRARLSGARRATVHGWILLLAPPCLWKLDSLFLLPLEFFSLLDWTWSHQFLPRLLVVWLHLQYRFLLRFVASERVTSCKWACDNLGWLCASNQWMLRNVLSPISLLLLINGCCGMSSSPISLLGCISASNLYIVSSTIAERLQSSIYCITSTIVVLSSALVTRGDFSESVHILYFSFLWWNEKAQEISWCGACRFVSLNISCSPLLWWNE